MTAARNHDEIDRMAGTRGQRLEANVRELLTVAPGECERVPQAIARFRDERPITRRLP